MDELAGCEVFQLFRGDCRAQDFVSMRVTAEAGDDVAVSAGLVRREFQHCVKLLWCLFDEFLYELDRRS